MSDIGPEILRETIISDEAHFHLGGFVNKSCFWSDGVIGPYFSENEAGATLQRLDDFVWPVLDIIFLIVITFLSFLCMALRE